MLSFTYGSIVLFLSLSLSTFTHAAPALDDIFEVAKGSVDGSCDPHLDLLNTMFQDIQTINGNTVQQLTTRNYNSNAETRKLLMSMFGISPGDDDKVPKTGVNLQKLSKVREWFSDVQAEITGATQVDKKPRLYCDSSFMRYMRANDVIPGSNGKTIAQEFSKKYRDNNHIYLITDSGKNEWLHLSKRSWDLFPAYPNAPNNPTYCANHKWYAWTLEGDGIMSREQPIVILCPESFTKQNLYDEDIPDQLDLLPQKDGKVLDQMEPRLLTWYHELFHVAFDPENGVERSPDASYWRAKKDDDGDLVASWPRQKSGFENSNININGAVECMYLALYDLADPPTNRIGDVKSTKNPESYAWFAVANYLSTVGDAHQDWSTGACREEGADVSMVTVTRGNVPKRTAEPERPTDRSTSLFTA